MEYLEFLIALIFYTAKELKIAPHISIIVNSSLASAIFPNDWNSARVTPPLCLIYVLRCLGNKKNFLKVSSVVHKSNIEVEQPLRNWKRMLM